MKVNLSISGDYLHGDKDLQDYAYQKIRSGLKSKSGHIKEVIVRIDSVKTLTVNSERKCSVLLYIPGQIPNLVKKYGHNIFSAISKAVETANHKCRRRTRQRFPLLTLHGI